ncbi:MAG: ATP synthase F1 subunit delta [Pyrinomonadaceae bacterium]
MSIETIARRYATALADVVAGSGETETVKSELRTWEQLISDNPDLQSAFRNPSIQHASKEKVLESLLAKVRPSKTTGNFLRVLLRNSRLTELRAINDRFDAVLEERGGSVIAEVTSAREMSAAQANELKTNLERLTGKQVKVNYSVDPSLIGGVITQIGSTIYDSSVRTQLENLKEELIGA